MRRRDPGPRLLLGAGRRRCCGYSGAEQSREGIGDTSIVSWGTTTSRGLASSGLVW